MMMQTKHDNNFNGFMDGASIIVGRKKYCSAFFHHGCTVNFLDGSEQAKRAIQNLKMAIKQYDIHPQLLELRLRLRGN